MGTINHVSEPPKKFLWKVEIDGRNFANEEEIIEAIKMVLRGDAWYLKTQFRDPKKDPWNVSKFKRNHAGGYWFYTVWFNRKNDAALFKLMNY